MFDVLVESHVRKPTPTDLRNLPFALALHAALIAAVAAGSWFVIETVSDPGTPIVLVDYLTVRGKVGWEVYLVVLAGASEATDLAFFEAFIASFAFTD